jgi:hypothetical protein
VGDRGRLSAARRPLGPAVPALLGLAWLAALFAPLARPGLALASRDVALFHLPLRTAFARLAAVGPPVWNPWLNGGQPLLSNPNYAAFYPPSWLALALPPAYALNWLVIGHAALGFAGAWRLVRRLGGGRAAAALAALAWSGGGAALSLLASLTIFCSMAWLPWTLAWGDAALRSPDARTLRRGALAAGGALALQALNGEPTPVVVSALGLACLALSAGGAALRGWRATDAPGGSAAAGRARAAARAVAPLALVAAVALGLAAVQLLPTWARLAGSARAGGLPAAHAATWSAPPARLAELAWPRFFGDPARVQEGLYFGWHLNDRGFPYVPSIYPGLLLSILGLSALARWPIPRRAAWGAAALAGAALALGRHDPLYGLLRRAVPGLALLRYPEKFVLLALAAVVFAGALGWQRLAEERRAGRRDAADFPLALALVVLATAAALAALLARRPGMAAWLVVTHGAPNPGPGDVLRGVAFLRGEATAAVASAAAVAALLALCRFARLPERALGALAVALLALDLWHYGHGMVATLPAAAYRVPPPLARALLARGARRGPGAAAGGAAGISGLDRIYVEPSPADRPELLLRAGNPSLSILRTQLARLEPYSGVLWGLSYGLDEDYDLMLTSWGRLALFVFHAEQRSPELAGRFLGAWNVGALAVRRPPSEWIPEAEKNGVPQPARLVANPFVLPRYRFPRRVSFHPSYASALAVARLERYELGVADHCVRPAGRPATVAYAPPAVLALDDRGGRLRLRYRAAAPAFFVFATTYDGGWQAAVEGRTLAVYPTAACQLGLELPAGEHTLDLRFREPRAGVGGAVSLLTLAACAGSLARRRRRGAPP